MKFAVIIASIAAAKEKNSIAAQIVLRSVYKQYEKKEEKKRNANL